MLRNTSRLFAAAAVILVAVAAYELLAPPPPAGSLAVDRIATDFGTLPLGEHRMVVARVANSGRGPARVLGVSSSCGQGACYEPIEDRPLIVPPGEAVDIVCLVTLRKEGPVDLEVRLYLDNGKFEPVDVRVTGIAIPIPRATDGAPPDRP